MDKKFRKLLQKWKYVVYLFVAITGAVLILIAKGIDPNVIIYDVFLGIGCSIIATAFVTIIIISLLPNEEDDTNLALKKWGITAIYSERQNIKLSKKKLPKNQLDFIAFGLSHFRNANTTDEIKKKINNGLNIRIITMHPGSKYVKEQEKWENRDGLRNDILELLRWKNQIVQHLQPNARGSFEIKLYDNLPMSFYCRADHKVYTGPYIPGEHSGKVITFEFEADSNGGRCYSEHFEKLWKEETSISFVNPNHPYLTGSQKESIERLLKHFCNQMWPEGGASIISVVVLIKGDLRRTFFSCNKLNSENHNCHKKDKGAVGKLIELNAHEDRTCCLFRDYNKDLTFIKTTGRESHLERKCMSFTKFRDDEMQAILAAPILHNNKMIGAVTFDFSSFPTRYESEVGKMSAIRENTNIQDDLQIVQWISLSQQCANIIEKMLGESIEVQYTKLYEEEWKCDE